LEALEACASSFLERLRVDVTRSTVVGLTGDLGSGKTAFVKAIAKLLGISEHVTSPTFVIQKMYEVPSHEKFRYLVHIDAYRLEGAEETNTIEWERVCTMPHTLVLVEWPERMGEAFPDDAEIVSFTWINDTTRSVEFQSTIKHGSN